MILPSQRQLYISLDAFGRKRIGPMSIQIYIDGKFYSREDAKVSVFDHTLLYGDGVFEGIRVYGGCIFRFEQHLDRLYDSAKYIMLAIPLDRKALAEATAETVRRSGIR